MCTTQPAGRAYGHDSLDEAPKNSEKAMVMVMVLTVSVVDSWLLSFIVIYCHDTTVAF